MNLILLSHEYFLIDHQCHPLSHDQMAEYCKIITIHLNLFSMKLGIDSTSPPIKIRGFYENYAPPTNSKWPNRG